MGARLLKQWLESPLTDVNQIQRRQAAVAELIHVEQRGLISVAIRLYFMTLSAS